MSVAKVIGNVVVTQKDPKCQGMKLLLIQPHINKDGGLVVSGSSVVAVDSPGRDLQQGSGRAAPGHAPFPRHRGCPGMGL